MSSNQHVSAWLQQQQHAQKEGPGRSTSTSGSYYQQHQQQRSASQAQAQAQQQQQQYPYYSSTTGNSPHRDGQQPVSSPQYALQSVPTRGTGRSSDDDTKAGYDEDIINSYALTDVSLPVRGSRKSTYPSSPMSPKTVYAIDGTPITAERPETLYYGAGNGNGSGGAVADAAKDKGGFGAFMKRVRWVSFFSVLRTRRGGF